MQHQLGRESTRMNGCDWGPTLCYMHAKNEEAKAVKLDLGPMEDPDSIQVASKKLQAAVIDQTLTDKQIAQLTNLLNIGAWNVIRTSGFRGMEK
jgi:hypothetical protein